MDISQIINELGEDRELYFNAVAPPIIQTSNFTFNKVNDPLSTVYSVIDANPFYNAVTN